MMEDQLNSSKVQVEENDDSSSGNKRLKTCDGNSLYDVGPNTLEEAVHVNNHPSMPVDIEDGDQTSSSAVTGDDTASVIESTHNKTKDPVSSLSDTQMCPVGQDVTMAELDSGKLIIDKDLGVSSNDAICPASDKTIDENISVDASISSEANIASCSKVFDDTPPVTSDLSSAGVKKLENQVKGFSNYHLKWFDWKGEQTPIVTQNENGPCPLLAIANVLILARKINLPKMQQLISGKQLMEYIGDCILAETPKQEGNEELILNFEQNMQDAIDIMHKLQTGIDVNVRFSGVTDFEFTPECIVFDLLKIQLYHGWLVDPQDTVHMKAVGGLSYNQLVEKMLLSKDAEGDKALDGLVIEEFLVRTASQLTYHGLCELNETIQEEELCVFFRNNHFSTLYKHKGELFLLVTDQGYLTELSVIWETLVNIEGDGQFVNQKFLSVNLQNDSIKPHADNLGERTLSQEDRDYLIALSLQQDIPTPQNNDNISTVDNDHKLALKLQEEENRFAQQQQQLQLQQQQAKQRQTPFTPQQQTPPISQQLNPPYQQQSSHQPAANTRSNQHSSTRNNSQQQTGNVQQQQHDRDKSCCIL